MEDELFTFKNTKQLTFGSDIVVNQNTERRESNSSSDGETQRRKRRGKTQKKTRKCVALDPRPESPIRILNDSDIQEPVKSMATESLSDSDPPSPPLHLEPKPITFISKLSRADEALNQLKSRKPQENQLDSLSLITTPPYDSTLTGDDEFILRVRCRGKIHKYPVQSSDIWARICHNLAAEMKCSPEQVLLSHRTVTMDPFHTLGESGITVGDIVDAVIVEETIKQSLDNSLELSTAKGNTSVAVTFRTINKTAAYKLDKFEPLLKGMKAFAASLGIALSKLHFTFDGEPLDAEQTAGDLDLQDDDVIDVRVS